MAAAIVAGVMLAPLFFLVAEVAAGDQQKRTAARWCCRGVQVLIAAAWVVALVALEVVT